MSLLKIAARINSRKWLKCRKPIRFSASSSLLSSLHSPSIAPSISIQSCYRPAHLIVVVILVATVHVALVLSDNNNNYYYYYYVRHLQVHNPTLPLSAFLLVTVHSWLWPSYFIHPSIHPLIHSWFSRLCGYEWQFKSNMTIDFTSSLFVLARNSHPYSLTSVLPDTIAAIDFPKTWFTFTHLLLLLPPVCLLYKLFDAFPVTC